MTPAEIQKLQTYLRKTLGSAKLAIRAVPKKEDVAEVFIGDKAVGGIMVDDEDDSLTYQFDLLLKTKPAALSVAEMLRIQALLRDALGSEKLVVKARGKLKDSCEVFVGTESIGTLSVGKTGYEFQMAVLDIDLEETPD